MQIGTPVHFVEVPLVSRPGLLSNTLTARFCTSVLSIISLSVYKSQVSPDLHPRPPRAGRLGPGALPLHFALWLRVTWPPLTWGLGSPPCVPGHNHIPTPSRSDITAPWSYPLILPMMAFSCSVTLLSRPLGLLDCPSLRRWGLDRVPSVQCVQYSFHTRLHTHLLR